MNININLKKNFATQLNKLQEKYGEEFAKLNGVSDEQLSFTDFIDNFIDTETVADASIDGNANVGNKDMRTLMNEMPKPHRKLLAYHKIYYELNKKYGFKTANDWLEAEWNKALYMHDADTSTFVHYSYKGSECVRVMYKGTEYYTSFSSLFDLVNEKEELLCLEDEAYCKYTNDLFVWDKVNEGFEWTPVKRVIRKKKEHNFHYIRTSNGLSEIVTSNHPVITKRGDVNAVDVENGDELFTFENGVWNGKQEIASVVSSLLFKTKREMILGGKLVNQDTDFYEDRFVYSKKGAKNVRTTAIKNLYKLDSDLGYIVGLAATDGTYSQEQLKIAQNDGKIKDKLIDCCEKHNIPYYVNDKCVRIGSSLFAEFINEMILPRASGASKRLSPAFINYNVDFVKGIVAGIIDGDGYCLKKSDHECSILLESRELLNQVSYILRALGYKPKDMKPRFYNSAFGKKFSRTHCMYQIKFNIYKDSTVIPSVKITSKEWNKNKEQCEQKPNKRYTFNYDDAYVYGNIELLEDNDEYVYDITTSTGHFICNNILSHNCFAYDLKDLAEKGLYFLDNFNYEPAQHLPTFMGFVKEFISFASNRSSGAVGLPNLIPYMYYFWKKDCEEGYYIKSPEYHAKQQIQNFIYAVNQPYVRDGLQSAFTNVSVFDKPYLEALFGGAEFPDGTFMIDYIDEIEAFQKTFMEVVSEIRNHNMFTFPVLTISLLRKDGKFEDEEFAKWGIQHNMKWNDSNLFIDDSVTSLSNCCRLKSNIEDLGYFNDQNRNSEYVLKQMYKDYCKSQDNGDVKNE